MDSAKPVTTQQVETSPSLRGCLISLVTIGEVGVIAALLLIVVFFYILQSAFLSARNIRAILNVVSLVGIIAIGQTLLLVAGGVCIGGLIGLLNGIVVVKCRIPAFIQTLGMLFVGQGLIQLITGGYPVYLLPQSVSDFGMSSFIFGLGWRFVFFVVGALVADFILRLTVLGYCHFAGQS